MPMRFLAVGFVLLAGCASTSRPHEASTFPEPPHVLAAPPRPTPEAVVQTSAAQPDLVRTMERAVASMCEHVGVSVGSGEVAIADISSMKDGKCTVIKRCYIDAGGFPATTAEALPRCRGGVKPE